MRKIDQKFVSSLARQASLLQRKRINFDMSGDSSSPIDSKIKTWSADGYVRPHRHENHPGNETWAIIQGQAIAIEFDEMGLIVDHALLGQEHNFLVELKADNWHTILPLEPDTVIYEVKEISPSHKTKTYPKWAPIEGSPEADVYRKKLLKELGFFVLAYYQEQYL